MNRSRPNTWIKQIALLSLSVVMLGKAHATTPANLAAAAAEPAANASGNVGANINGAPRTPIFEYSGFNRSMPRRENDGSDFEKVCSTIENNIVQMNRNVAKIRKMVEGSAIRDSPELRENMYPFCCQSFSPVFVLFWLLNLFTDGKPTKIQPRSLVELKH